MKFVPKKIYNLIKNNNFNHNETVIFDNEIFLVVEDIKHQRQSYHYTAWIKKDIRSIIEIDSDILNEIINIKNILQKEKIIKSDHHCFIHFPPSFWRLHIHFVDNNHCFKANDDETLFIDDIIKCYNKNCDFFKQNVRICKL